ncbi:hypothetical protein [Haloarcula argentinensis]|uniref:hypothetical protein n=1 Tax=Haloarcula argentinensis TaxID=43776 RepID=UPI0012692B3F
MLVNRRKVIAGVGASCAISLSGCLGILQSGGQIANVEIVRNSIEVEIKDSSKVSKINIFYQDEVVKESGVSTGEDTASVSLLLSDDYDEWEYPDKDFGEGDSYRAGDYRIVAVGEEDEQVGSAELSLEPELEVVDIGLAREFENNGSFRDEFEVSEMGDRDQRRFLDAAVVLQVENKGNAPELVGPFTLDNAETATVTFEGFGMSDDEEGDVGFISRPRGEANFSLPVERWVGKGGEDFDPAPDANILESGKTGYFVTEPFLHERSGKEPTIESLNDACSAGVTLQMSGGVHGAAGDSAEVEFSRKLAGDPQKYRKEDANYEYWCKGQTLSMSDSSTSEQ